MIEKDESGRRRIGTEIEVPGKPEEVWQAIATSDGISSWFYRSQVDRRVGGTAACDFGPGMESREQITEWNPPERFATEAEADPTVEEHAPRNIATEWTVEARSGDTCRVRVVHSWFADSDDWDGQFEGHVYGWAASFFPALRLYLGNFNGQRCTPFQFTLFGQRPWPQSMRTIKDALGISITSEHFESQGSAPILSGRVQSLEVSDPRVLALRRRSPHVAAALETMGAEEPDLLLWVERPAPGLAYISVTPIDDQQAMVSVRIHFFGDEGIQVAPRAEQEWSDWLNMQFPSEDSIPASTGEFVMKEDGPSGSGVKYT